MEYSVRPMFPGDKTAFFELLERDATTVPRGSAQSEDMTCVFVGLLD